MAEELGVKSLQVKQVPELKAGDILFLGCGVYWNRPARAVSRYIRNLPTLEGVKVALFGTYGLAPRQLDAMANLVEKKAGEILGRFSCKGRDWFSLGLVARGHPNATELKAAAAFARNMVERTRGEQDHAPFP